MPAKSKLKLGLFIPSINSPLTLSKVLLLNNTSLLPSAILVISFLVSGFLANSCLTVWFVTILPNWLANANTLADVFLSVRTGLPSIIPNTSKKSVLFILFFCWTAKPALVPVLAILALSVLV